MGANYPVGLPQEPPATHCLVNNTGYGQNAGQQGCGPEQWAKKWRGAAVPLCVEEGELGPHLTY